MYLALAKGGRRLSPAENFGCGKAATRFIVGENSAVKFVHWPAITAGENPKYLYPDKAAYCRIQAYAKSAVRSSLISLLLLRSLGGRAENLSSV